MLNNMMNIACKNISRQQQLFVFMYLMTLTLCSHEEPSPELWLEDYTRQKISGDNIQSDSPRGLSDEDPPEYTCPTFPTETSVISKLYCLLPTCSNDLDCDWPIQKCCNNGCLNTCMAGVAPPPLIDWRREPQRDIRTGISWLIKDETNYNEPEDDEADSISEKVLIEDIAKSHLAEMCEIDNTVYKDGSTFTHNTYICKCHKGLVDCYVAAKRE